MEFIILYILGFFGSLKKDTYRSGTEGEVIIIDDYEHFYQFYRTCVGSSENKNVTYPQKGLILWHRNLGISMYRIQ